MKVIVEVPDSQQEKIRRLIRKGKFTSFFDFVNVAIENQLILEETGQVLTSEGFNNALIGRRNVSSSRDEETKSRELAVMQKAIIGSRFPELSLYPGGYSDIQLTPMPKDKMVNSNTPLWGQYNRLLPVKVALRLLANTLKKGEMQYVDLEQFREHVAEVARDLGLFLREQDRRTRKSRGERTFIGFPVRKDEYKSKERFKDHFVGYVDTKGHPIGALSELKMVSIVAVKRETLLGITEPGLTFAAIRNPVLDGKKAERPFSEEEAAYYLQHVWRNLPGEREAVSFLLQTIKNGVRRPDYLTAHMQEFAKRIGKSWNRAVANTMRAGLMSRLYELGILEREKVGIRGIAYNLSSLGSKLLEGVQRE